MSHFTPEQLEELNELIEARALALIQERLSIDSKYYSDYYSAGGTTHTLKLRLGEHWNDNVVDIGSIDVPNQERCHHDRF